MRKFLYCLLTFLIIGSAAGGAVLFSNLPYSDNRGGDFNTPQNSITATAPDNTDLWTDSGNYATSFAGGDGQSEATAYRISTPEQLARLAYLVNNGSEEYMFSNTYFVQTANLDMSEYWWDAIGTSSYYFSGHYDGGNFTISGLYTQAGSSSTYSYQGLFGYVRGQSSSTEATIKNVGITDSNIQGYQRVGGVVGYAYENSIIENCYNTGSVTGRDSVGGVAGEARSLYGYVYIMNCYNTGFVSGSEECVGGVVGYASSSSTVTNCYNNGSVEGSSDVGGVAGMAYESDITNCYNTGSVSGGYRIGGVVGHAAISTIINCYNTGNVTGSGYDVGGVVGEAYYYFTITNCYNTGSVSGGYRVGGVVGDVSSSSSAVTNCYYGGNCTLSYGIGSLSSNTGASKDSNLIANAKSLSWYQDGSKWDSEYPWDFEVVWTFIKGANDDYPILQYATEDIIQSNRFVSEIYNDAEGKMDEENVGLLLEYLLGESDVDVTSVETMNKLNSLAGGVMTSADIRDINAGIDITVRFGGLDWTVAYFSKDKNGKNILTLWLNSSQQDAFIERSSTEGTLYGFFNNSLYSDWSNDFYDDFTNVEYPTNMYGTSYIRAVTLNNGGNYSKSISEVIMAEQNVNSVFARFTMEQDYLSNSLTGFLVKPNSMSWQINQNAVSQDVATSYLSNESINDPALSGGNNWGNDSYNYHKKSYYDAWGNDYLWLPSLSEVGYDNTHSGIWQISKTQRMNFSLDDSQIGGGVGTDNSLNGGYVRNRMWLRSAYVNTARSAYALLPLGEGIANGYVSGSFGVRPALHLNMTEVIKNILGVHHLTLDDNGGSGGASEIFASRNGYFKDEDLSVKISSLSTLPTRIGYTFNGYYTLSGVRVIDINGDFSQSSTIFNSDTTLYAQWEANNPAYYDEEGGYWYIENGRLPQTRVSGSLKTTLQSSWGNLETGSTYTMDATGDMVAKIYEGNEYCAYNGEYYRVEPIKWRLTSSASQTVGYGTTTATYAIMDTIVYVGRYSVTEIGAGDGYQDVCIDYIKESYLSETYLASDTKSMPTFGTGASLNGASQSFTNTVFVSSREEIMAVAGTYQIKFSDFVMDFMTSFKGTVPLYYTRDLGTNYNHIICLTEDGEVVQRQPDQIYNQLGVQFTIKVSEYACVG